MSSILDLDGSSDENDGDYVPPNFLEAPSDSSGEDDEASDLESDQKPKSGKGKRNIKESKEPEPEVASSKPHVEEKKRTDEIWLDFLSDVSKKPTPAKETSIPVEERVLSSKPENKPKAEVFEFAGETFTVSSGPKKSHECPLAPSEPSAASVKPETAVVPKKRGGVESILSGITSKKKKLTTLEKTLYDWQSFKKDEGLDEDLEKYNLGKGGFIERQRFLERSDVRSFEIEKSMRQLKRKK